MGVRVGVGRAASGRGARGAMALVAMAPVRTGDWRGFSLVGSWRRTNLEDKRTTRGTAENLFRKH